MSDRPKYVRLRGLPFSSKEHDIRDFLEGCNLTCVSLTLNAEGRASGEAFVGLRTEDDVAAALAKNKELIQKRYIEVFRISHDELGNALRRGFISEEGRIVKLRGLPFSATERDIAEFLADVDVEEVVIGRNAEGRASGEAFVRLASPEDVPGALQKNKEHMGKRYVEVFESKPDDINRARGIVPHRREGPPDLRDLPPMPLLGGPHPMMMGGPHPMGGMDRSPRGMGGGGYPPPHGGGGGVWADEGRMMQYQQQPQHPPRGGMMEMGGGRGFPQKQSRMMDDYDMYEGGEHGGPIRAPNPSMGQYARASPYDAPPRPLGGGGPPGMGYGGGMGGGGGGMEDWNSPTKVLMRGLPFDVTPAAIERFFAPLRCYEIKLGMNEERRPTGDGCVEFGTISEAREALMRHKQTIGPRYIELYASHDVPPSARRSRFRRVGGAAAIPPAPLTTPSHRSMPAAPIPTGRPAIPAPRYDHEQQQRAPAPMHRGYADENLGYGAPPARGGAMREQPGGGQGAPRNGGGGEERGRGAYGSFPSREYNGGPVEREAQGYGRPVQEAYGGAPATHAYGAYEVKAEKRESYDEGYGMGGGGYGRAAEAYDAGYGGGGDAYGAAPAQRRAAPQPAHNGAGDYGSYAGYGGERGGGGRQAPQYGARQQDDRYF